MSLDSIGSLVADWASHAPDSPAIEALDGRALSYGRLADLLEEQSGSLKASGIGAGDRVAFALPNGPTLATLFLTVASVATAAPLNPSFTSSEFRFYLDDLRARALIVLDEGDSPAVDAAQLLGIPVISIVDAERDGAGTFKLRPAGEEHVATSPADPDSIALVLHTSGTTAKPKIVPLTHANLITSAGNVARTLELSEDDKCLNVMPLFHIHGLVAALLATIRSGGTVLCTDGFQARYFFDWLEQHDPTWYTAVPTMHQAILDRGRSQGGPDGHRLRFIRSSSASLAPSVIDGLENLFAVPVIEAYGMTEAAHQMTSNPLPPGIRKPGSVGLPAGPEVSVTDQSALHLEKLEIGEVVIRGPNVTSGYHGIGKSTDHFDSEGWFRTGDQGYVDLDGYLFLTGRLKELINRGGETIAPREIDEALLKVGGIRQAVAFGVEDEILGEEVAAAVVTDDGADLSEKGLQDHLSQVLTFAKIPKRILFVDEIPKGPTGKLQRIGLAERLGVDSVRSQMSRTESDAHTIKQVSRVWKDVLELDTVDPDEEFRRLGGDSLSATALAVAIETEFDLELPLLTFYEAATIRQQAALIEDLLSRRE